VAGEKQQEADDRDRPGGEAPGGETRGEEGAREGETEAEVPQREEEAERGGLGRGRQEGSQCEPPETQAE
jgi:hypothetical protein